MYRNRVQIDPFTTCDDLLVVSECGYQTELMAAYLKCQSRLIFLQFGLSKCYKMHVGKYNEKFKCQPVFLDSWKSHEVEENKSGQVNFQEYFEGKVQIKEVENVKYLGNSINTAGTNIEDITVKCNRGIEIINKIITNLETMFLGNFYFEVGKTMIDIILLGSILDNKEVAYTSQTLKLKSCNNAKKWGSESGSHCPANHQKKICIW